jgi:hypothetical protein
VVSEAPARLETGFVRRIGLSIAWSAQRPDKDSLIGRSLEIAL